MIREQIENELAYSTGAIKPSGIKSILFAVLDEIEKLQAQAHEPVAIPLAQMQEQVTLANARLEGLNSRVGQLESARTLTDSQGFLLPELPMRDYLAAAALASLVDLGDNDERITPQRLASEAYNVADAMLATRGDKPAFQPQKFIADYSRPHKFDFWKMSGLRHTEYRVCKCGFSEDSAIHQKENQDEPINGQPKSITIEFADEETGKVEQAHGYDLDGTKETPIEESYGGTDPE